MSPRILTVFAFLLTVICARADLEFSGFFTTAQDTRFILTDTETQVKSGWLRLNSVFQDHTLVSYDAKRDILVVRQGARTRELPLRPSKVKDGRLVISGDISIRSGQKLTGVRTALFFDEESAFPLDETTTLYLKPVRLPDGNLEYHSRFVSTFPDGKTAILSAPRVTVLPNSPFSIQAGDYGYTFTP